MRIFLLISLYFLVGSCANIVPPTGGPKDTEGPKIVVSAPATKSTSIRPSSIIITFNEPIADNQLSTKLIVSPSIKGPIITKFSTKSVRITWKDTLKDNTTYVFNLNDGVKDLQEGTPCGTPSIIFSTGSEIDSTKLEIMNESNIGFSPKNKALLFPYSADSVSLLHFANRKPWYSGNAMNKSIPISYVAKGDYTLIITLDENNNGLWDTNEEVYYKEKVRIDSNLIVSASCKKTTWDSSKVNSIKQENNRWVIDFNKGIQNINAQINGESVDIQKKETKKYELYYKNKAIGDSVNIKVDYIDSVGNLSTYFGTKKYNKIVNQSIKDSISTILINKSSLIPGLDSIFISWNDYIDTANYSVYDWLSRDKILSVKEFTYGALVMVQTKEDDTLFFKEVKGIRTASDKVLRWKQTTIITLGSSDIGILSATIKTTEKDYFIRLYKENTLVWNQKNIRSIPSVSLEPGTYKIEVFIDRNNNAVYDAWNPNLNNTADTTQLLQKDIIIKANWEVNDIQLIF
ncbi:MAG: Ig-like domain-containing protein [Cytophagaceae bacterium]|jgi:hypothetical protein|nr:Ig-like domain-containing protein [Cytophagaceae bacterium]